jgi:adenosylcobyric acid synthase
MVSVLILPVVLRERLPDDKAIRGLRFDFENGSESSSPVSCNPVVAGQYSAYRARFCSVACRSRDVAARRSGVPSHLLQAAEVSRSMTQRVDRFPPALMVLGTGSHVGKSILTAALGRIFANAGYRVAPFKAQNMSLNSAATPDGREIGRAQALQAEACRVTPCAEMNPVLMKPSSDTGSQIVVLGKVWRQVSASDYHRNRVEELFPLVLECYSRLAAQHQLMLIEGAGSPAEINLRDHDIVNMRMAHAANAACLLVGDIDRGGVFASLFGTLELLEKQDRKLVRGYAINKFRGDRSLLEPGIQMMAPRMTIPCVGVLPYLRDLGLDEEDGVSLEERRTAAKMWKSQSSNVSPERPIRIGVVAFPHLANFTDFDPLAAEPSVSLAFLERPEEVALADMVILPGSKQTLQDLEWLHLRGFDRALAAARQQKKTIIGICGGFQMLGLSIKDPAGMESQGTPVSQEGLKLLPINTTLLPEKITRQARGKCKAALFGEKIEAPFRGYEIHLGETVPTTEEASSFASIQRERSQNWIDDGAVSHDGRIMGTYIHGLFDDDDFRHAFINAARTACGLAGPDAYAFVARDRDERLNRLAKQVEESLDMRQIAGWLGLNLQSLERKQ